MNMTKPIRYAFTILCENQYQSKPCFRDCQSSSSPQTSTKLRKRGEGHLFKHTGMWVVQYAGFDIKLFFFHFSKYKVKT